MINARGASDYRWLWAIDRWPMTEMWRTRPVAEAQTEPICLLILSLRSLCLPNLAYWNIGRCRSVYDIYIRGLCTSGTYFPHPDDIFVKKEKCNKFSHYCFFFVSVDRKVFNYYIFLVFESVHVLDLIRGWNGFTRT